MPEIDGVINLAKDIDKLNKYNGLSKEELYYEFLGRQADIYHSIKDNRKNDTYVIVAEIILISNKLMEGA